MDARCPPLAGQSTANIADLASSNSFLGLAMGPTIDGAAANCRNGLVGVRRIVGREQSDRGCPWDGRNGGGGAILGVVVNRGGEIDLSVLCYGEIFPGSWCFVTGVVYLPENPEGYERRVWGDTLKSPAHQGTLIATENVDTMFSSLDVPTF